jgi:hypothetical protein
MKKTLTSLALVAGCAITLAVPATQAQTMDTRVVTTARRLNECGPDKDAQLLRDALKNAIGPTILGSNGVVFRIVLELMPPSQCDIRLLA